MKSNPPIADADNTPTIVHTMVPHTPLPIVEVGMAVGGGMGTGVEVGPGVGVAVRGGMGVGTGVGVGPGVGVAVRGAWALAQVMA